MNSQSTIKTNVSGAPEYTAWVSVVLLYLAGCTTALHVGKVPSAIPLLQEQWQLSLTQTGLLISLYSIMIASCGFLLGTVIRRLGYVPFAIFGVGIVGVGGCIGAVSESLTLLLLGRAIEGLGWIISVIVLPSILACLSAPNDKNFVTAAWASFMPVGAGTMLFLAPALQTYGGWQLSWVFASLFSFLAAFAVFSVTRRHKHSLVVLVGQEGQRNYADLKQGKVWLLSGCFFTYSFGYIPLLSFFPLILVETSDLSLGSVSMITALVLLCNAVGSTVAGVLLRRGYSYFPMLVFGLLVSGAAAFFVFAPESSTGMRIACAFIFSSVSGVVPGALFATMPKLASKPPLVGLLVGLMMQASGVGMLVGGVIVPGAADLFSTWAAAGWVFIIAAIGGAIMAWLSQRQAVSVS